MEEGMRKAEAQRPDSHAPTLCPSRRHSPLGCQSFFLLSSWNKNKHLLPLRLQGHHTQRAEPQGVHPRPPKGLDRQRSPDLGGRAERPVLVVSSILEGGTAVAILRAEVPN